MSSHLGLIAVWLSGAGLGLVAVSSAAKPEAPDCLAIGFGHWAPEPPGWAPGRGDSTVYWLVLTDHRSDWPKDERWYDVRADTVGQSVEQQPGSAWFSFRAVFGQYRADGDSLELLRRAALSEGFRVAGTLAARGFRGRAHAFSDLVQPPSDPRANVYGVRYRCHDAGAAALARARLLPLLHADTIAAATNAAEIQREERFWDSVSATW